MKDIAIHTQLPMIVAIVASWEVKPFEVTKYVGYRSFAAASTMYPTVEHTTHLGTMGKEIETYRSTSLGAELTK
jgi:hypothetical protein